MSSDVLRFFSTSSGEPAACHAASSCGEPKVTATSSATSRSARSNA
ncbi:hypothetical protein [Nonomuraea rosea]